ncbi:MAG: hypothetical protein R2873_01400 [Caldilineaceae bacterium]
MREELTSAERARVAVSDLRQSGLACIRDEEGCSGELLIAVDPTALDQGFNRGVGQIDLFAVEAVETVDLLSR